MRIIFKEPDCGYEMIFNTDWTFGKRILEICWKEMTFENFCRKTEREHNKMSNNDDFGEIIQKSMGGDMMKKFRKKTVVIEAIQWNLDNKEEVERFVGKELDYTNSDADLIIPTLEGDMNAHCYDWIIKGVKGEFYPCKPDIFNETYEEAK